MTRVHRFFLCFIFACASLPEVQADAMRLNRDSLETLPYQINDHWKFFSGDEPAMALPVYDDSQWKYVKSTLQITDTSAGDFKGLAWLRLHFSIDSTLAGKPLAFTMTHFGASEIYVDGKKLRTFGEVGPPDKVQYDDPSELPFTFVLPDTGEHVIAVRYANYKASENFKTFLKSTAGFRIGIGEADRQIARRDQRSLVLTFTLMLLCGIFLALSLIHFFMYVYYREAKSNLYFTIFMFSLALVFMLAFIMYAGTSPSFVLKSSFLLVPAFIMGTVAMSGFITEQFAKKRTLFFIVAVIGLIAILMRLFWTRYLSIVAIGLVITVAFQVLFTTIFAMVKKVKGARIIGFGILFFALFILTIFTIGIIQGGSFDINDSTLGGRILICFMALAIISIPVSMSVYLAWRFSAVNRDLAVQLEQVKKLSQQSLEHEQEKQRLLETKKEELEQEVWSRTAELREEKRKADDLLLNILPEEVAIELKEKGRTNAKTYSQVTVMFTDFQGFTEASEKISAELLVSEIDHCFSAFDHIIQKYKIEKIKTIGDAYLCAGGLPGLSYSHAEDTLKAALEIRAFMVERKKEKQGMGEISFDIRIGLHTGPVVAGIVGIKKFAYDIWGDTVNTAARMEQSSEVGKINISGATYDLVKNKFTCMHRGKLEVKNKGEVDMYYVSGLI